MKKVKGVVLAFASAAALCAFSADSVVWPADFEAKLAAHVEELKPSGDQTGESAAFASFDSVCEVDLIATLGTLRNFAKPGFLLFFK